MRRPRGSGGSPLRAARGDPGTLPASDTVGGRTARRVFRRHRQDGRPRVNVMTAAAPELLASLASALVLAAAQQAIKVLRQRGLPGRQDKSVADKKRQEK